MSRLWWIIILVAAGVGLAILIGVLGNRGDEDSETKSEATSALCGSLKTLETSIETLVNIDTSTATKSEFQSDVDAVQTAWDQVKTDAGDVQDADTGDLDSAWDDFESAVKGVPDDASVQDAVSDVSQAADELESTAKSTASSVNCS